MFKRILHSSVFIIQKMKTSYLSNSNNIMLVFEKICVCVFFFPTMYVLFKKIELFTTKTAKFRPVLPFRIHFSVKIRKSPRLGGEGQSHQSLTGALEEWHLCLAETRQIHGEETIVLGGWMGSHNRRIRGFVGPWLFVICALDLGLKTPEHSWP